MGKNFQKELSNLNLVYQSALSSDIHAISDFLQKYSHTLFWGVGSGGSYSVARIFEYFCARAGWTAKSLTPLELRLYDVQMKDSATILFTAGGRNADSKNAYKYLSEIEPEGLLTCCMHVNSPLKKLQRINLHNYYFEYKMPVAKDGYLAVESLVSSLTLLSKAFEGATGNLFFRAPSEFNWHAKQLDFDLLYKVLCKESLLLLHGGITTPAAFDLESKFSEAALGNIQLTDFRNFAHGRHYWISDRGDCTAVIAMVGTSERALAEKTLPLLPNGIPILRLDVSDESVKGMLDAFDFVFEMVLQSGVIRNLDPGRPKVSEFGKKLYHLNYNICAEDRIKRREKSTHLMAVYRKSYKSLHSYEEQYRCSADKYLQKMATAQYAGIVFDYDGTLHDKHQNSELEWIIFRKINTLLENGVKIGIATGRGKSVRNELRKVVSEKYWKDTIVAYYNGGCIGTLEEERVPDKTAIPFPKVFETVSDYIGSLDLPESIRLDGLEDRNPYQLTLLLDRGQGKTYIKQIKEFCSGTAGIKVLLSGHSMDIIPRSSSKNNIFSYWDRLGLSKADFLTMGDAGQFGGNDYELLKNGYGLSVDGVSDAVDGCWNFARPGVRNLEATLYYLEKISLLDNGRFVLRGLS